MPKTRRGKNLLIDLRKMQTFEPRLRRGVVIRLRTHCYLWQKGEGRKKVLKNSARAVRSFLGGEENY